MKRIRVLIVDGSSVTRQILSRLLPCEPDLEVVGTVASGRFALARINDLCPDVVVLDLTLPDLEGLLTLAALRETHATLPVIMFSRLTERGSRTAVDALLSGASDYVTKPESSVELERCILSELIRKIRTHGAALSPKTAGAPEDSRYMESAPYRRCRSAAEIVAIATSTGGPNALASLLSSLPRSFLTPIVIVQHMPSGFTATLAESLRRQTGRNVREVETIQPLHAAEAWIAPGGRHLMVTRRGATVQVAPSDDPPENACCPSADVLFRSVAEVFGSSGLAVVLTGLSYDGLAGCRAIRQAGGSILVQDEASSVAWGMPGQIATAGLADEVLSLDELATAIARRTAKDRDSRQ